MDFEPTLESILNDAETQSISDDEGHTHGQQISSESQVQERTQIQSQIQIVMDLNLCCNRNQIYCDSALYHSLILYLGTIARSGRYYFHRVKRVGYKKS